MTIDDILARVETIRTAYAAQHNESVEWLCDCVVELCGASPVGPSDEEIAELIKPLWLKTKPSREAQALRSSLSVAFDDPRFRQWASDYMPEYIWDLVDIAAQWGINTHADGEIAAHDRGRREGLEEAARLVETHQEIHYYDSISARYVYVDDIQSLIEAPEDAKP